MNNQKQKLSYICFNNHIFGNPELFNVDEKCPECGEGIKGISESFEVDVKNWAGIIGSAGTN